MFAKRYRITLLFNANKAYDRQVVEGWANTCRLPSVIGTFLLKKISAVASTISKTGWAMV